MDNTREKTKHTIICGNALTVLKEMPSESVDMVITSPPYYGLRDYFTEPVIWNDGCKESLGREPDFNLYINHLLQIIAEIKRVLKKSGSFYLNLADTYSSFGGKSKPEHLAKAKVGATKSGCQKGIRYIEGIKTNIPDKCLCLVPERIVIEMVNQGWILRNKICWFKPNSMPSSVRDRFKNSWEYLYFFVKSQRYYYDLDAVREPYLRNHQNEAWFLRQKEAGYNQKNSNGHPIWNRAEKLLNITDANAELFGSPKTMYHKQDNIPGRNASLYKDFNQRWKETQEKRLQAKLNPAILNGSGRVRAGLDSKTAEEKINALGKNPGDVISDFWELSTQPFGDEFCPNCNKLIEKEEWIIIENDLYCRTCKNKLVSHFAVFPPNLIKKPILASSPQGGIVLDPFAGSGTTALVCEELGRNSIMIELNSDYCKMIKARLEKLTSQSKIFEKASEIELKVNT